MSGMYSVMLGDGNEMTRAFGLSRMLGLKRRDFGRLRDAWVEITDEGRLQIAFYTRNGGGNRESHASITEALRAHPDFLHDADDNFDSTYATYRFAFPESPDKVNAWVIESGQSPYSQQEWDNMRTDVAKSAGPVVDTDAMWEQALAALQTAGPTPDMLSKFAQNVQVLKFKPDNS